MKYAGYILAFFLLNGVIFACDEAEEDTDEKNGAGDSTDAGSDSDTDSDTDSDQDAGDYDGLPCPDGSETFIEDDPGISMFFMIGVIQMMGQDMAIAAGGFTPAAREEFDTEVKYADEELDTCTEYVEETPVPECTRNEDCAPEQQCLPETDPDTGEPIPGTESCVTPREMMDVGPFTVTGFSGTPLTFTYNPAQSGAYMASPDGTLDPSIIEFDTEYVIEGDGDPSQGLGEFGGTMYLPDAMEITHPEFVQSELDLPALEADPEDELLLKWTGGNPDGTVRISLSSIGGSITCTAVDDGEFTIPAEWVKKVRLGGAAFFNLLEISREGTGRLCGEDITVSDATYTVTVITNVMRKKE